MGHVPVLLGRVLASPLAQCATIVDATFGLGGHSLALLAQNPSLRILALDRDPSLANPLVQSRLPQNITLVNTRFSSLATKLSDLGWHRVDGVLFDFGVNSVQLGTPARGFSYMSDGPIDMRMSPCSREKSPALHAVNALSEHALAGIIAAYGEDRCARKIARAIAAARPLHTTLELAQVVARATTSSRRHQSSSYSFASSRGHPAQRTFQALRIHANDELHEIAAALPQAVAVADTAVVAISFHSLEDRIAKRVLGNREKYKPARDEVLANKRSKSAIMRVWTRERDGEK